MKVEPSRKAFVLLSGGLDSTTCLYQAVQDYPEVEAISIDYGQRHIKEAEYAKKSCAKLNIKHSVISLGDLLGKSMLTDASIDIPNISYSEIKGVSFTYVPNRNMTMLSVLTVKAQVWINEDPDNREAGIYAGMHSEDAQNWAYPDCTPEFLGSMCNAIFIASYQKIRLHTPLQWLMKKDIVELGSKLGVPFEDTWSCYKGLEYQCGICPTCRSRKEAFEAAEVFDPTPYEDSLRARITKQD